LEGREIRRGKFWLDVVDFTVVRSPKRFEAEKIVVGVVNLEDERRKEDKRA
jgi:hypothetical protein